jgi:ABC-type glycerol-3-phosphate transport system substrate-binding protein
MKMRKFLALAMVALMLAPAVLFAAGSSEAVAGSDKPVEIKFKHVFTGSREQLVDAMVKEFNASQNRIIVSHEHAPGWYGGLLEQLQVDAVARQLPEVAIMGMDQSVTMRRELGAVSLQKYIDREKFDMGQFFPKLLMQGQDGVTGEQFAMPWAVSTPMLYINKDLFRKAGLDPNKQPVYWSEVREWAKKINDLGPDISGFVYQFSFDTWQFQCLLETFGGQMGNAEARKVQFNEEAGQRTLEFLYGMIHTDKSVPLIGGTEAQDNYLLGKLGILMSTTGNYGAFSKQAKFDFGTFLLPEFDDPVNKNPRRVAIAGSSIFMLPSQSQAKQDAAWEFIKFAVNQESAKKILQMGYMAAHIKSHEMAPEIRAYEMLDDAVRWYNWPRAGARITNTIRNNIDAILAGKMPIKAGLDATAAEVKQMLNW